ncbi:MAG: SPOR domain-containing protein [Gammaproteobacteria bacterium]
MSHDLQGDLPLHYMTFIAAGDLLQLLDGLDPGFVLEITSDGLRRMARMLVPDDKADPLEYNQDIDPALRKLFGLEPPESAEDQLPADTLSWLIKSAHASTASAALQHKLNNWVPTCNEISEYLSLVHQLLNETNKNTIKPEKLDSLYKKQYHDMLLATAWQESCWRQFIRTENGVKPITSSTGSVGIMQVNRKVWRGLYNAGKLETDIACNAHAVSEILLHYFKDYAMKKELGKSNAVDSLARATYAAYNGGPRQLARYRESATPERLRKIDVSFWEKYKKIKSGDIKSVAGCYGETAGAVIANSPPAKSNKTTKSTSRPTGLLQSDPDNYTIQLMSSRSETQIIRYIQENKLAGKAEYYTYRHNNETWYGLVYGSFATRTAAEARAQSLKQSMGLSSTWGRQLSSIQKLE